MQWLLERSVLLYDSYDGERPGDTLVYLLLPVLTLLGAGFFIDHALGGYARPLSAAAAGLVIGAVADSDAR